MLFWLKYLKSLLQALNADISPNEIAAGVVLGAVIGLIPKANLLALGLWIIILLFRVHIGMAGASLLIFSLIGFLFDPVAEKLGFWLLAGVPSLASVWTALYNVPIVPFTSFNNTMVMGNFALGGLLALPLFFGMRAFVIAYRARYRDRVMRWKIMKLLKASQFYGAYGRWMNRP